MTQNWRWQEFPQTESDITDLPLRERSPDRQ